MYTFEHLPAYATFLLNHHLDAYVTESIRLSYEVEVPLLKHLRHLSPQEQFQISKHTSTEFLTYLSQNRAQDQIKDSLQRWLTNQLELIDKYDIDAGDITIINYVRARVLKRWM